MIPRTIVSMGFINQQSHNSGAPTVYGYTMGINGYWGVQLESLGTSPDDCPSPCDTRHLGVSEHGEYDGIRQDGDVHRKMMISGYTKFINKEVSM